jgi:hypothetical protein
LVNTDLCAPVGIECDFDPAHCLCIRKGL